MAFPKFQPTSIITKLGAIIAKEAIQAPGLSHQTNQNLFLTYGPEINEMGTVIPFNQGTAIYDTFLLQQISSDIILMYGSFYSQLYRKTGSYNRSRPVPRTVKDMLLKENFPVHKVRNR